jgi:hypothetical protein
LYERITGECRQVFPQFPVGLIALLGPRPEWLATVIPERTIVTIHRRGLEGSGSRDCRGRVVRLDFTIEHPRAAFAESGDERGVLGAVSA